MSNQFAEVAGVASAGSSSRKALTSDLQGSEASAIHSPVVLAAPGWLAPDCGWPVSDVYASASYPQPVRDQKPSWGFGGETPDVSALCAAGTYRESGGPSLLDSLENNRNNSDRIDGRPLGRARFCGRWSVCGINPKTGRKAFRRVNCGAWTCSYCGPRKAR